MRAVSTSISQGIARASARSAAMLLACMTPSVASAQASAGAQINNIASLQFAVDGQETTVASNPVATRVGEILDVALRAVQPGTLEISTGEARRSVPFLLTNSGNGTEAFFLNATVLGNAFPGSSVVIDLDRNGIYDPAIDTMALAGGNTPALAPGASVQLLVVLDPQAQAAQGTVSLHARAVTGSGTPGTSLPGRGDGGSEAIVGSTSAAATAEVPITIRSADASVIKSQQVSAPDGTSNPVSGATITYRLEVVTRPAAILSAAVLDDPIPVGTDYVPGTLQIDGAVLSDADDGDNGRFDGGAIRVALGDIAQPTMRIVTFQVKIR